jgi:hypothetical protein
MINLRFHIVSIVAIFLALAIGMLAGSTLLDRATVDVLKGRQKSLDSRNASLRAENDELRAAIEAQIPADDAFGSPVLGELVPGVMTESPVLILATRGIDEDSVRALQTAVRDAGGAPLGIVWFDARFDLDNDEAAAQVASALGLDVDPTKEKQVVVTELAKALTVAAAEPDVTTTTEATAGSPDTTEAGTPTTEAPAAPADDPSLTVLSRLVDADLLDWESPNEGEPGSRTLPAGGLDLILLSGEGSELRASRLMTPLVKAVAARVPGAVVGEVRRPRTTIDAVDQDDVPERGSFVDTYRTDDGLSDRLITVDNVDEPFGRLALVLALGQLPALTSGSYGVAPSASQPFPTPAG